jgi:uncharacterized protein YutE (UPF0331/DUF86 family)
MTRKADGPDTGRSVRRKRLSQRLTLIESNYKDLKESLRRHYPDEDSFVADWTSTEFEAQERIAALERFYERIVNALNQVVDDAEKTLDENGELPGASPVKQGQEPGRWQRLAGYGALPAEHVDSMRRLIGKRNIFQKEYDTLGAEAGAEIFGEAKEFARLLPKVIPPISNWVDAAIE